jgi:hypothetical protein
MKYSLSHLRQNAAEIIHRTEALLGAEIAGGVQEFAA